MMEFKTRVGASLAEDIFNDDRVVNELLIESKFHGRITDAILAKLWIHGHRSVVSLIRSGQIFGRCSEFGRPVSESYHWSFSSDETIFELADETVTAGLGTFKSGILGRNWRDDGGASIQTYFVNACILAFPNVYRRLRNREERAAEPLDAEAMLALVDVAVQRLRSKESEFAESDLVNRVLSAHPPQTRSIVAYVAEGYTARETAAQLGTTSRAVEAKLLRLRIILDAARGASEPPRHELGVSRLRPDTSSFAPKLDASE